MFFLVDFATPVRSETCTINQHINGSSGKPTGKW